MRLFALLLLASCAPLPCPVARTHVDGICVSERVADYVACVRAQGASLSETDRKRLSLEATYVGATVGAAAASEETANKEYAVADPIVFEIVRSCKRLMVKSKE